MSSATRTYGQAAAPSGTVTDLDSLERELARRHHTPEHVEQFGVEAVPREKKTSGFGSLFGVQLSFQINNLTIILPGFAVLAGLNIWAALLSQVIGVGLVFIGYTAIAHVGVKYGIPGQVASRMAFGMLGSRITASLMRSIASAYWFAWQTLAAALGIQTILHAWTGETYSLVLLSVLFAIFQAAIALTGWDSLKYLAKIILPIKLVLLSVVIIAFLTSSDPRFAWATVNQGGSWAWNDIAFWAAAIAGGHLTMYTDSADLARYSRSAKEMALAFYSAVMISVVFCGFIGIYAAKAMGDANWFVGASSVQPQVWMYILLVIVLVADNWFINIMNLYTGGFAVVNAFSGLGRFWSTVIVAVVGIVLSGFRGIYENIPTFVNEIGLAFGPVGGIMLAHYIFLSHWRIELPSIYRSTSGAYRYWNAINPVAIVVGLAGYALAHAEFVTQALIKPLFVMVVTGIAYAIAMKIVASFWPPAHDAIDYEAMKDEYDLFELDRSLLAERQS
jgi:nucleobase:cation symporter-1, NCS1 family